MVIRKLFKFEAAHIVRGCSTERCSKSIHGHSYKVEVFLHSGGLDNAGMIMDFSLLKKDIGSLIDGFDHAYIAWNGDDEGLNWAMKKYSKRYIGLPFIPTAEIFAIMFFVMIRRIIEKTEFANGEKSVGISSVRVHETDTGYAEASFGDDSMIDSTKIRTEMIVSDDVFSGWSPLVRELYGRNGR